MKAHSIARFFFVLVASLGLWFGQAQAAGNIFDTQEFDADLLAKKPVVVHVHAVWCPVCRAQDTVLEKLEADPAYKNVRFLEVDYDGDKKTLRKFNATRQSTIIVFKDGKEVGRSLGQTNAAKITELVQKAL